MLTILRDMLGIYMTAQEKAICMVTVQALADFGHPGFLWPFPEPRNKRADHGPQAALSRRAGLGVLLFRIGEPCFGWMGLMPGLQILERTLDLRVLFFQGFDGAVQDQGLVLHGRRGRLPTTCQRPCRPDECGWVKARSVFSAAAQDIHRFCAQDGRNRLAASDHVLQGLTKDLDVVCVFGTSAPLRTFDPRQVFLQHPGCIRGGGNVPG
jgi:hypothetical protein